MNGFEAISRFLELLPEFQPVWEAYVKEWGNETPGPCYDFAQISDFVHTAIVAGRAIDLPAVFELIEGCLAHGDETVQVAASTCFLENLQNKGTPPSRWNHLLGPKSTDFCRAWDDFTGVSTPGL